MAARMAPRFRELTDVDWSSFTDGEVATYDGTADQLTGEPGGGDAVADLATHAADTTNVHGIADTTALASDAELAAHIADTTFIHGVTNTSDLATDAEVASAVSTHSSDTTSVHGITDTTVLATDAEVTAAVSAHESDTTVHGVDTANVPSSGEKAALAGTSGTPSVSNRFVTEDDPALGGADLADAVVLAPGTPNRNLIEPTADEVGLTLKGNVAQTDPIQVWLDSDDERIAWLSVNGRTFAVEIADGADASGVYLTADPASGTYIGVYGPDGGATGLANWLALWSDSTNRHEVTFDGAHKWSNGTDATDTTLERTDVGELSVNGEPIVLDDDARLTGGVDQGDIDSTVATHSADTTSVHGIADTTVLATDTEVATAVSDHSADTTSVHGIADTSALATLPIAEANVTGLTAALAAKQPIDSDLTSLAALTTTSFGRGLLELANQGALLTAAGAAASAHSHAESDVTNLVSDLAAKQASDATLTALAGLATGADKLAYSTGTDTFSQTDLTSFARTVLDDTTAAAARTTLGASAMGLVNGQTGIIAPSYPGWRNKINTALTAQRVLLSRFVPSRDLAVTKMAYILGTAGGAGDTVDCGIYDSTLANRLGSSGAVVPTPNQATDPKLKVVTLTATVNLTAGTVYYAALLPLVTAGAVQCAWFEVNGMEKFFGDAIGTWETAAKSSVGTSLPTSISGAASTASEGAFMAVRES